MAKYTDEEILSLDGTGEQVENTLVSGEEEKPKKRTYKKRTPKVEDDTTKTADTTKTTETPKKRTYKKRTPKAAATETPVTETEEKPKKRTYKKRTPKVPATETPATETEETPKKRTYKKRAPKVEPKKTENEIPSLADLKNLPPVENAKKNEILENLTDGKFLAAVALLLFVIFAGVVWYFTFSNQLQLEQVREDMDKKTNRYIFSKADTNKTNRYILYKVDTNKTKTYISSNKTDIEKRLDDIQSTLKSISLSLKIKDARIKKIEDLITEEVETIPEVVEENITDEEISDQVAKELDALVSKKETPKSSTKGKKPKK